MIDEMDYKLSKSVGIKYKEKGIINRIIRRLIYGRVKNDWNETLRFYDVPVDEFHLKDIHEQQIKLSYSL